jgi:hypothetical protein
MTIDDITKKIEKGLRRMNYYYNWRIGVGFVYFMNKTGAELNKLETIENPKYLDWRTQYTALIRRAKEIELI